MVSRVLLTLLLLGLLSIVSCTKQGQIGPQGQQGPQGAAGVVGPAGANGTIIYSGTTLPGAPASALGTLGDFYLDIQNYNLYGPKSASGWGAAVSLQGPAGTANVLYTSWVDPSTYSMVTGYGGQDIIETTVAIPALTADNVQNSLIICYGDLEDYITQIWPTNQVGQLPVTLEYKISGTEVTDVWECTYQTGSATLEEYNSINEFGSGSFSFSKFR